MSTGTIVQVANLSMFGFDNPDDPGSDAIVEFSNGLVFADPHGGAWVATGIYMGMVRVSWSTGHPPAAELDEWEDVVQVVITPSGGVLSVCGYRESGPEGNSPNLALDPEAEHMLRCYAKGRDIATHGALDEEDEPVEEYYLELWLRRPDDEARVLKLTSEFGKDLAATEPSEVTLNPQVLSSAPAGSDLVTLSDAW